MVCSCDCGICRRHGSPYCQPHSCTSFPQPRCMAQLSGARCMRFTPMWADMVDLTRSVGYLILYVQRDDMNTGTHERCRRIERRAILSNPRARSVLQVSRIRNLCVTVLQFKFNHYVQNVHDHFLVTNLCHYFSSALAQTTVTSLQLAQTCGVCSQSHLWPCTGTSSRCSLPWLLSSEYLVVNHRYHQISTRTQQT